MVLAASNWRLAVRGKMMILPVIGLTCKLRLAAGYLRLAIRGKMMILPVIGLTFKLRLAASNWRQAVRGKILNLQVIVYYLYNQTSYAFNFMESKTIFYTSQPLAASCQLLSIKEPEL